ncbi:hypothetical protein L596_026035 [Steinernema carpocapsae]|uniref:Uncharacterized protein n=1 Tax=Steinernema carpocapsae TaxID=34508 RepID=A0A4U5M080_STECR|nr:hypothetical protein L596_026035 [Steinernema carpocapsae]
MLVGCATLFLEAGSKGVLDKIKTQFDVVRSEMTQMKHENHLRDHMTAFLDVTGRSRVERPLRTQLPRISLLQRNRAPMRCDEVLCESCQDLKPGEQLSRPGGIFSAGRPLMPRNAWKAPTTNTPRLNRF